MDVRVGNLLLLLLLFSPISYSQSFVGDLPAALSICFPFVVIVVVSGIAIIYMGGHALGNQQLEALAKFELTEVFKAAVHLGILLALFGAASTLKVTQDSTFISHSIDILDSINGNYTQFYNKIAVNYGRMAKIITFSYDYSVDFSFFMSRWQSRAPLGGYGSFLSSVVRMAEGLTHLMALNSAIKITIIFMQEAGTVLLVLAFLFRIVPFTRSIGITLMSALVATYIFLPLGIYMMEFIMANSMNAVNEVVNTPRYDVPDKGNPPNVGTVCNNFMHFFLLVGEEKWAQMICPPLAVCPGPCIPFPVCRWLVIVMFILTQMSFALGVSSNLMNYVNIPHAIFKVEYMDKIFGMFQISAFAAVSNIISYLLIIFLMFSVIRSISMALGEEAHLYGLSKLA